MVSIVAAYKQEKICWHISFVARITETWDAPDEESPKTSKDISSRYNIPESFSAFCSIVSFTAAKTSRILLVSVACVKLREGMC